MPEGGPSAKWKPLRNNGSVHAGMTAPFRFADGMLSGGQRRRSSKNKPSIVRQREKKGGWKDKKEWERERYLAFPWTWSNGMIQTTPCVSVSDVLLMPDHPPAYSPSCIISSKSSLLSSLFLLRMHVCFFSFFVFNFCAWSYTAMDKRMFKIDTMGVWV